MRFIVEREINMDNMVDKKTWQEFKDSGLLWWINMILHTFGWAIVFEISKRGKIINVYPARVKYRGFDMKSTENGYIKVSKYMDENSKELLEEARS